MFKPGQKVIQKSINKIGVIEYVFGIFCGVKFSDSDLIKDIWDKDLEQVENDNV